MSTNKYKRCSRCVMDTTDFKITFDEQGVCNHCLKFDKVTSKRWFPNEEGIKKLELLIQQIKDNGKNHEYDCIIGLSGGVDSSYLAIVLKDYGLRPLVVHVDAGWNSELSVYNIEQIVKYCGYDLHTHVMDWEEIRDLQKSYLKAGVANQDVIQDHAFFASLYHFSVKNKIKYIISGGNIATECVFPQSWHHSAMDAINLKAIHKRFGETKLRHYKTISFFDYYIYYPFIKKMKVVRPLNLMPYCRENAIDTLVKKVGYKEYGRKHGESVFTKFFQSYYLPEKFNMDKRIPHLSSHILSDTMSREDALVELKKPLYTPAELETDKAYIAKKLAFSMNEFEDLIKSEGHSYSEYANWDFRYKFLNSLRKILQKLLNKSVSPYY